MEKETRCFEIAELRVSTGENDKKYIEGYAAVFDLDSADIGFIEQIRPGAFKKALKKSDTRALINHNPDMVLGRTSAGTLELKEDKRGLFMKIDPPDTQYAKDLMVSIARGDITQQSFGFTVSKDEWDVEKEPARRTIVEVDTVFDVSPVTYPAYQDTTVALRSLENERKSMDTIESKGNTLKDAPRTVPEYINEYYFENDQTARDLYRELQKIFENVTSATAVTDTKPDENIRQDEQENMEIENILTERNEKGIKYGT